MLRDEQPAGVPPKRPEEKPSMIKLGGLWVHQGSRIRERTGIGSLMTCARSGFNPYSRRRVRGTAPYDRGSV